MPVRITNPPDYAGDASAAPSYVLAQSFHGVEIPDDASPEQQHRLVDFFIRMYELLERQGWYDHTSDWDFHIGLTLTDGRKNDHIGDGATIAWADTADPLVYGGEDVRADIIVGPNFVWEEDGETDSLKEFRFQVDVPVDTTEYYYRVPISMIRDLEFGYCT